LSAARISKRQLKEDTFIATTLKAWEYVRENEKYFFIGLVALVCIAALVGWSSYARKQGNLKASSQFAEGLASFRTGNFKTAEDLFTAVMKEHGNRKEGIYASYFLGKCALETGRYLDAINAFDRYLAKSKSQPFFHDAAMEGKAIALESSQRYEEAGNLYRELAGNLKNGQFLEATCLRRSAENYRLCNRTEKAIEVLGILLDKATGTERRDIEIELEILRG